jgi:hypothetical protein
MGEALGRELGSGLVFPVLGIGPAGRLLGEPVDDVWRQVGSCVQDHGQFVAP